MNGTIDKQHAEAVGDAGKKMLWLTPQYVDCECDEDYIKAVPEGGCTDDEFACAVCGAVFSEQPDSRVTEVQAAGLPYDPWRIEFVGYE